MVEQRREKKRLNWNFFSKGKHHLHGKWAIRKNKQKGRFATLALKP